MAQDKDNEYSLPASLEDQNKRKTARHLPRFFRTDSNKKFLGGTLDPLTQPGKLERINAYIGRKDIPNFNFSDNYIQETSTPRQYYQLEPSFINEDQVTSDVNWYADYIDYINSLKYFGANVGNHSKLNKQEAYTWNPHVDWDKIVNYREYYWLSSGPDPITIYGELESTTSTFTITSLDQEDNVSYVFTPDGLTVNPRLTLYRGIKYRFEINAPNKPFAIKTEPKTGDSYYYDFGVSARNVSEGVVEFEVPYEAPDLLYYMDNNDIETVGMIDIKNIQESSALDIEKEIIGKKEFTSSNGIKFINGLKIKFSGQVSPKKYANDFWYVEGVGDRIQLVNINDLESPAVFSPSEDLPFDNQPFDSGPWDNADSYPKTKDYIVINRSSRDRNTWTRNNRWFHRNVIETSANANGIVAKLDQNNRANRPIIEFEQDLKLYNHGYFSKSDIDLVDTFTTDVFSTIEGSAGYIIDGEKLYSGYRVLFTADTDSLVNGRIFEVKFILNANTGLYQITLQDVEETLPDEGQVVYIKKGKKYKGSSFHYENSSWKIAQKKTGVNQAPLFDLFDNNKNSFSDISQYPFTTFEGNRVFGYKIGSGANDSVLGFPLTYRNINNIGDIEFEFNLEKDSWTYISNDLLNPINSYSGFLRKWKLDGSFDYVNGWTRTDRDTDQNVIRIFKVNEETDLIPIDVYDNSSSITDYKIRVYINNKKRTDLSLERLEGTAFIRFKTKLSIGDKVVYKIRSISNKNSKGFYEIPLNWQNNPLNQNVDNFTFGEVIDHVKTIVENVGTFEGDFPGISNLSNLGKITQYGRKFMQHSGPMSISSFALVDRNANVVKSIKYCSKAYTEFKKEFLRIAKTNSFEGTDSDKVDQIIRKFSESLDSEIWPFYYSDMAPYLTSSVRNYVVSDPRFPVFPIDNVFDPKTKTKESVLIYVNDTQLLYGRDYNFNSEDAFIEIKANLALNDKILIKFYGTTNGSYIPPTPSKLGLYPLYEPAIYKDDSYRNPTWVIQGHDGSLTKAYGSYGDNITELDFRDAVILELEKRIFNNTRVDYDPNIFNIHDVIGGYYRRNEFTKSEINDILLGEFLRWNSIPSLDFNVNDYFIEEETFTYNYNKSLAPNNNELLQGYWRAIYKYFYDTDRPHTHPWEMQGFTIKPLWWDEVYGIAPYTKENKILWEDIEEGLINDPNNIHIDLRYARPGLSLYIPVDSQGKLLSPLESNLAQQFSLVNAKGRYSFGDQAPVETAWRRSSEYPYAIMILCSVLRGAEFITKMWDRFTIKRNIAGQIYSTITEKAVSPSDLVFPEVVNKKETSIVSGLVSFIDEYVKVNHNESFETYKDLIRNINVKLSYRIGGFTSKEKIKVLLDSRSPNASGTIFLPEENYKVFYNKSAPVETVNYSGVLIEKKNNGYSIKGYDTEKNYFEIFTPRITATDPTFTVGGVSEKYVDWTSGKYYTKSQIVKINDGYYRSKISHTASESFANDIADKWQKLPSLPIVGGKSAIRRKNFNSVAIKIPYGTTFMDIQSVVDFLLGYQERLRDWGFEFDDFSKDLELPFNWLTSAKEFMFWTLQNWAIGSVITLSPAANKIKFKPVITASVDQLDADFYDYSVFKADGQPLKSDLTNVYREDNGFEIKPTGDTKDGIFHIRTNLIYREHIILFDNKSIFSDVIYDVVPGYRQGRVKLSGFKTTDWNGGFYAPGFLYDQAEILLWKPYTDYNIGDVIQYQTYYFTATRKIYGKETFEINDGWKQLDKNPVEKLIPNFDYKIEQFRDFYSLESSNFDENQQSLSRHLIGYQPRQYLDDIIIDDVSQYKFYQGFIKEKGTLNSVNKLFDALRASGFSSIDIKEEWAFKVGDYGASEAYTEIEFPLDEEKVLYNPQDIVLTLNKIDTKILPIYNVSASQMTVKPSSYDANPFKMKSLNHNRNDYELFKYKVAGYVKDEDVEHIVYDEATLLNYDISSLQNRDKIWLGNTPNGDWTIYEYLNTKTLITNWSIEENTISLYCNRIPDVVKDDIIAITNLNEIDGMYKAQRVYNNVIEIYTFNPTVFKLDEDSTSGILYKLEKVRFNDPSKISYRRYNDIDIRGEKVWIDKDSSGRWLVLENADAFTESELPALPFIQSNDQLYGYEVKISDNKLFMFVSVIKSDGGKVIVYSRPNNISNWGFLQTITLPTNFGTYNGNEQFGTSIDVSSDGLSLVISAPNYSYLKSLFRGNFNSSLDYLPREVVRYNNKLYRNIKSYIGDGSSLSVLSSEYFELLNDIYDVSRIGTGNGYLNQGVVFTFIYDNVSRRFERERFIVPNTTISREQIIGSYDPHTNEKFGSKIKLSSNGMWLFVSSKNYSNDTGRVQVFRKTENGWQYNTQRYLDLNVIQGSYPSIYVPEAGSQFGYDICINEDASIIVVSAPFITKSSQPTQKQQAGAVYVFHRTDTTIFLVQVIDSYIFDQNLITVESTVETNYYLDSYDYFGYSISLKDDLLFVSAPNNDNNGFNVGAVYYFELVGITDSTVNAYKLKQLIVPPSNIDNERFGSNININSDKNVLVISAIGGNSVLEVTFDSYSERTYYDDSTVKYVLDDTTEKIIATTFDAKSTSFYDKVPYTGAVYIYNKFSNDFIYADKLAPSSDLATNDNFGFSIDITNDSIVIGTPYRYKLGLRLGTVFVFDYSELSWKTKESQSSMVDISKFKKAFIYDTKNNVLIDNLDFIDPAKGKIAGIADQEIKYQTYYDPAVYEFGVEDEVAIDQSSPWADDHVGELWWDLSKVKWVWYEQGDSTYRNNNWGRIFTGSSIDIYEWVESIYLPSRWAELADTDEGLALGVSGIPKDIDNFTYSTKYKYDTVSGTKTTLYYYWVKNKTIVPRNNYRSMSAADVAKMILDPKSQGYKFVSITSENSLSLVNVNNKLNDKDISLNLRFYQVDNVDLLVHREYALIAQDDANSIIPSIVENKWFDSLVGYNVKGQAVPDPKLGVRQRYGSSNDPRQTWFVNRFEALKQLIEYVNSVLIKNQIVEEIDFTNLLSKELPPDTKSSQIDKEVDILDELRFVSTVDIKQAKLSVTVLNGEITNVFIDDPGKGYLITPTITISGTGTGAEVKAVIDSLGKITSVNIVKPGKGYDNYSTLAIVRQFTVLVSSDEEAGGAWSLHKWDGKKWFRVRTQSYDVTRYWSYSDWYATGYGPTSEVSYEVKLTKDLYGLPVPVGKVVKVVNSGNNSWLLLKRVAILDSMDLNKEYEVVGSQNATIQFSDKLYNLNRDLGFDTKFSFDLNFYDQSPTNELRIILKTLRDDILVDNLRIEYIKTFFNSIHYALHEHLYVDWVFKTSFLKINHNVGSLKQRLNFQSDVLDSYQSFVEEAKPYKSKIREFVSSYNGIGSDNDNTDISYNQVTDFDLPSYFNTSLGRIEKVDTYSAKINEYPWKSWLDNHTYKVSEIIIWNQGNNYISTPKVIISGGGGTGASATAYVANGKIYEIVVDNPGQGYTSSPNIFISGGNGDDEENRAIAYAKLGDNKTRSNYITMKYDRCSHSYAIPALNFEYTDTFNITNLVLPIKLTYAPEPEKSKIKILIGNIEIYGSQYEVRIEKVMHGSFTTIEGYIDLNDTTILSYGSTITITYKKNIHLYNAADRINYAYKPTAGMYGKELGQLMTGVDYSGVQLTSIDFDVSGGWDVLPWESSSWDNVVTSNDDWVVKSDGTTMSFTLPYLPDENEAINVYLTRLIDGKPFTTRIDDPYYSKYDGSTEQPNGLYTAPVGTIMDTFVGDGSTKTIIIPPVIDLVSTDILTFRKSTSDGTILPTDISLIDSYVSGGDLYTTARGISADEIIIDGDGFVTEDTSHGPEELVQGQVVDSLEINVYHTPSSGGPNVFVRNYTGDGLTNTYNLETIPNTIGGIFVLVDDVISNFTVNYEANTLTIENTPQNGDKIAIIIIDTAGFEIADKLVIIGDGSTKEFITSARYNSGNVSGFVTINGISVDFEIKEDLFYVKPEDIVPGRSYTIRSVGTTDFVQLGAESNIEGISFVATRKGTGSGVASLDNNGNVIVRFNDAPDNGDVIQIIVFNGLDGTDSTTSIKKWSEVKTQVIDIIPNQFVYDLLPIPANIGPLSAMAFVVVGNDFLQAPDFEYFEYNNSKISLPDIRYSSYSLTPNDIDVYKNGVRLDSVKDYLFDSIDSSITFNSGVVSIGDQIAVEIFKYADFRIIDNELIIQTKNYIFTYQTTIKVTTFTNHDIVKIKSSNIGFSFNTGFDILPYDIVKFDVSSALSNTSGIFNLPRIVSDFSGVFVALNRVLLSPNVDFVVLDNRQQIKVLIPERLKSSDYLEIITFNDQTVRPSYGFKIFKDMINRVHYKRLNKEKTTYLKKDLNYLDTRIEVVDGSVLAEPSRSNNLPGIIEIAGERIEYFVKEGNVLRQLRRATLGTGMRNNYSVGTEVSDIGQTESIPYVDQEIKKVFFGDETTTTFEIDFVPNIATHEAGKFIIGRQYKIVELGTTNFMSIGSTSNTVGTLFTATGKGSGTGKASLNFNSQYGQCDEIEVYANLLSNGVETWRRLNKVPVTVYDYTKGQDSYNGAGDKTIPPEFSVDGINPVVRLADPPKINTKIVVVYKIGRIWQKIGENYPLVYSNTSIAKFLTSKQVELPK